MMEVEAKEDFRERTLRTVKKGLRKLCRRNSVTITEYDPSYKVTYLGNVLTGWAKGEACVDKPLSTLWRNYQTTSKPDTQMKITVTQSGLKAVTKEHGLTEYWSHRISFCVAPTTLPKVFCWVYRHEGRKLKPELRCHAVLCSKDSIARRMANELQRRLVQALIEFKRDKISRQNARLSLANSVYDNPSLPRRKILLSTGTHNYKPPLERSKSAPKLMAIEENLEEEDDVVVTKCERLPFLRQPPQVKCVRPEKYLKRHASESRFGSNKLGGLLQMNFSKSSARDKSPNGTSAVRDSENSNRSFRDSQSVSPDRVFRLVNSDLDKIVNENVIKILSESSGNRIEEPSSIERIPEEAEECDEDTTSGNEVDDNPFGSDEHIPVPVPVEELTDFDEGSVTDEGESEEDFEKRMKELNKWNRLLLTQRSNSITSDISLSSFEDCSSEEPLPSILERNDDEMSVASEVCSNYTSEHEWSEAPEESGLESIGSDVSYTISQKVLTSLQDENTVEENSTSLLKDGNNSETHVSYESNSNSDVPSGESDLGADCPNYQTSVLMDYRTATGNVLEENPPSYEEAVNNQPQIANSPTAQFNSLVRDRKRLFERDQSQGECVKQNDRISQREKETNGDAKRSFFINNRRKIFEQLSGNEFKSGLMGNGNLKRKMSDLKSPVTVKCDPYSTVDEDSTPSLQSISSGNSDSSSVLKSGESNMNGYDLHSISSSEDSDESGFVESLTVDDPLNKNDDKSRDLPHHQLMKSCILSSKTRCVEV